MSIREFNDTNNVDEKVITIIITARKSGRNCHYDLVQNNYEERFHGAYSSNPAELNSSSVASIHSSHCKRAVLSVMVMIIAAQFVSVRVTSWTLSCLGYFCEVCASTRIRPQSGRMFLF